MTRTLLILIFLIIAYVGYPQVSNSSLDKIDELLFDSRFEEAISLCEKSWSTNQEFNLVLSNKKSEALIRLGKLEEAGNLLRQTLREAEGLKKSNLTGLTRANIGFLYLNQGRNDLALENLQKALTELNTGGSSLESALASNYLGQVYLSTGKYAQAEEQFQMALSIRQEALPETHELIAASYNDLGTVYAELDANKALDYYDKATAMYEKLHGKEHAKLAIANTNLGFAYRQLKLYGDAVVSLEAALAIWEKLSPQPNPSKAYVLMNLGLTYSVQGDLTAALGYYERALSMYESTHGKKHPEVAYVYNLIGNIKKSQDKFDEALTHYQKALIANVSDFSSMDITKNPSGKNFYNGNTLLYSMMYKAQAYEARHFGKTLKQSDLDQGMVNLQACDSLIDRLRQQATNESDKITLGSIANEVYADGVRIASTLSDVAFRKREAYRELCFYFAEKSKSAVLLDAISDANAKSFAGIPEDLLEEEKGLKTSIALVSQKLAQKPSEDEEKYLRETAFHLNQSYQAYIQNLEKQYPEYFNLKFNSATPSISQLQQLIDSKTAILSYFIDEGNSRLYTFIITKKKFAIEHKALPKEYDKYLTGLRNSLFFMDLNAFKLSSRTLYSLLIPKVPSSVKHFVILPTGRMSVIPFETLLTKKVKESDETYASLPYLINRVSIRYEFSAGLLLQKKKENALSAIKSAMLCAPVTFPEKDNLNDLPGTEAEVNTISKLFSDKQIKNQILLNHEASEAALKSESLKEYNLVHFATHGIVDENNPELSKIFLQNDSEAEDGNLFSGEIYNLELNADLVTLSACQTGLGKISKGEGVIGLSRALVYAGAKNIIVSFWSVADESTAELMTNFYKLLLEEPSINYSANLRQAKLDLMKGKYAAPYYWAPFILIGF